MKLMKSNDRIIRILQEKEEKLLAIDCIKRTMPKWIDKSELQGYAECEEIELYEVTGVPMNRELSGDEQMVARERFTLIASVLPVIGDEKKRSERIGQMAENVSKQTIRKYLCLYLVYQDIYILAPTEKKPKELTSDEKHIRWALNKYFYNAKKNTLKTSYTLMLKEKYCDENGKLLEEYPTYHQFRYFYRKHRKMANYYISREGLKAYQRNHRPLLGDGVQELASTVGTAMLDSTVLDIYLVNDAGKVVGRPIMTACVDAYSGLCMGYALTWEAGMYSLKKLMLNVVADKKHWCESHGVIIDPKEWNTSLLPSTFLTDMGAEYKSDTFGQITELGIKMVNLAPYRPELKGVVEKFFDVVQNLYKKTLKGKGVVESDFNERGGHDYRRDACLTVQQFEQIILHCIIYYNSKRILENFPYTEEMIKAGVKPYASDVFEWGKRQMGANLIEASGLKIMQVLLPRTTGVFKRNGLCVNGLRYKNKNYTEEYLTGKTVTIAYNPDEVSQVYMVENGNYIPFKLIETRFNGKTTEQVKEMNADKKKLVRKAQHDNLQAQIDLVDHISVIASQSQHTDVKLKDIRRTRKKEREMHHENLMKVGEQIG